MHIIVVLRVMYVVNSTVKIVPINAIAVCYTCVILSGLKN